MTWCLLWRLHNGLQQLTSPLTGTTRGTTPSNALRHGRRNRAGGIRGSGSWSPYHGVDGEKLRAMLLINPTKSTLLPILNWGEVGPKKNKADLLYLVQQATNASSIFSNQTSSQSLSPKLSEPNLIKTLILLLLESWSFPVIGTTAAAHSGDPLQLPIQD